MKTLLFCLFLLAQSAWANQADTTHLNDLIVKAVQAKDYEKAR